MWLPSRSMFYSFVTLPASVLVPHPSQEHLLTPSVATQFNPCHLRSPAVRRQRSTIRKGSVRNYSDSCFPPINKLTRLHGERWISCTHHSPHVKWQVKTLLRGYKSMATLKFNAPENNLDTPNSLFFLIFTWTCGI